MKNTVLPSLFLGLGVGVLACPAQAQHSPNPATEISGDFRRWLVHVDVANVVTNESADVAVGGAPLPGGSVSMADNATVTFDVSYFLTPNFAINAYAGYPPRAHIEGAGPLAAFGTLASANYGPLTVSGEYHFSGLGALRPYVGVGVTYAVFLDVDDNALSDVSVDNAFGPALKLGLDYDVSERWTLHAYVQQVWLKTDVSATVGGAPASARLTIDPTVVGVGLGYRF
ncbi:OmpW family outer membrane protein [Brevundimonas sp.]|jgi:outer membrane protein|uniref:OmpW/AlkL family protein n=1 Tax=Brevundimonas sp. TaxID=1871086 RepID=UPI001ACD7B32|nr:OmpW family outer membrane protein [Brevundimonas sp.]MBN9464820.1 OmpW family protein [Brevundimonas sp.]